jgi:hypothetical protein
LDSKECKEAKSPNYVCSFTPAPPIHTSLLIPVTTIIAPSWSHLTESKDARAKHKFSSTKIVPGKILGCRKEGAKTKPKEMKNDIENNTKKSADFRKKVPKKVGAI